MLMMKGFDDELTKEALFEPMVAAGRRMLASPGLHQGLAGLGAGAGAGAVVGGIGGGALAGYKSYQQSREQGYSPVAALSAAPGGAIHGALKGGLIGAGVGGLGLGALGAAGRSKGTSAALAAMHGPVGSGARFGQRQVHAITGWKPEAGLKSIGIGTHGAEQRAVAAKKALDEVQGGKAPIGLFNRLRGGTAEEMQGRALKGAVKEHAGSQKGLAAAQKAEEMGLTSIPGYAKSFVKHPLKTVGAGFGEQWHGSGGLGKTLMVGFPTATIGGEAIRKSEPGESSKAERVGRRLGDMAFSMGPLPIAGQFAAAGGISGAGRLGGKVIGKLQQKHVPAPVIPETSNVSQPTERVYSERSMGGTTEPSAFI